MRRTFALLTALCLLLAVPAAAQGEDKPTLVCSPSDGGYSLTLEGLKATVCALQLDLTLQGSCPNASFASGVSGDDIYAPELQTNVNGGQTAVTIYMTAKTGVLTKEDSLLLGTLKDIGSASLPAQGNLILLNQSLETLSSSGTIAVRNTGGTVKPPSGGGSSGGGGGGGGGGGSIGKPANKPGGSTTAPTAPSAQASFSDVPAGAYYKDAVDWAVANNITTGTGAGQFSPNDLCTRAQIVTFLHRAADSPAVEAVSQFSDVPAGSYFDSAVQWAVSQGITNGSGVNTFSPDQPCTRAQAVTFLYRANGSPAVTGGVQFTDVPAGAYYADAVQWAAGSGVTQGVSERSFAPDAPCTRAQIVTFLYRNSEQR